MRFLKCFAVLAMAFLFSPLGFAADATLPATGVDVGAYANALVANLGGVIGVAIGAGFAIFALWMGFKFVKKGVRG